MKAIIKTKQYLRNYNITFFQKILITAVFKKIIK